MNITDNNYKDVIENNNALIYLGASWCPGCKVLKPIVEEILNEDFNSNGAVTSCYGVVIGITDVDHNSEITVEYGIKQIPAVLFFKDGKLIEKLVGNSTTKAILLSKIEQHFN